MGKTNKRCYTFSPQKLLTVVLFVSDSSLLSRKLIFCLSLSFNLQETQRQRKNKNKLQQQYYNPLFASSFSNSIFSAFFFFFFCCCFCLLPTCGCRYLRAPSFLPQSRRRNHPVAGQGYRFRISTYRTTPSSSLLSPSCLRTHPSHIPCHH